MYATCLFCNSALGRNDCLEHFPVGRRLAYDAARGQALGRLPALPALEPDAVFESRLGGDRGSRAWIPRDAAARGDRQRRAGRARGRAGAGAHRCPAPARTRHVALRRPVRKAAAEVHRVHCRGQAYPRAAARLLAGHSLVAMSALVEPAMIGLIVAALSSASFACARCKAPRVPVVFVTDGQGKRQPLTRWDAQSAWLWRGPEGADWSLSVKQAEQPLPRYGIGFATSRLITLQGDEARRALAAIVPYANSAGGSAKRVRGGRGRDLGVGDRGGGRPHGGGHRPPRNGPITKNHLTIIPAPIRLAIEMALHEDDERRAMEGELAALEERWRDAEEIARSRMGCCSPPTPRRRPSGVAASEGGGGPVNAVMQIRTIGVTERTSPYTARSDPRLSTSASRGRLMIDTAPAGQSVRAPAPGAMRQGRSPRHPCISCDAHARFSARRHGGSHECPGRESQPGRRTSWARRSPRAT